MGTGRGRGGEKGREKKQKRKRRQVRQGCILYPLLHVREQKDELENEMKQSSKKGLQERGTRRHPGHSHGPRTRRALFVHFPRSKCSITQRPCEASICYSHSANEKTEALTHEGIRRRAAKPGGAQAAQPQVPGS